MLKITAPCEIFAFEDICILKPFIELLSREFKDVACESCFKRNLNLKSCKSCLDVKYCGKDCQKKDWKNHKLECQKLKNLPVGHGTTNEDITRIIGNTILKIKEQKLFFKLWTNKNPLNEDITKSARQSGKDWKTIKYNILGKDFSFDDIDASESSFPAYQHIYYNSKKEFVRRYIGDENMPNDEDFKQILGKISNSLYPTSLDESVKTSRILFELALLTIECLPNCHITTRNDISIMKAVNNIEKSEKLSVSKISLFGTFDIPGITSQCNCTDCRLPYGESVLTKISDEQKALEVIIMTQQFINTWKMFGPALKKPHAEYLLDDILEKHEDVLGDTNALHLKLLAIKCFETESDPLERRTYLLKLEKNIVAAFGRGHPHSIRVHSALSKIFFSMGQIGLGNFYHKKAYLLQKMFS